MARKAHVVALGVAVAALVGAAPAPAATGQKLSGIVWADADRDGRRDSGETRFRGAKVELQRKGRKRWARVGKRKSTSRRGTWSFRLKRKGRYRARVALPAGYASFSPKDKGSSERRDSDVRRSGSRRGVSPAVVRRKGARSRRFDAGLLAAPPGSSGPTTVQAPTQTPMGGGVIGDTVWRDTDNDGVRDASEAGEPGVELELWTADRSAALSSTTSDAAGRYRFAVAAPGGAYRIRVLLPTGGIYSPTDQGADDLQDSDVNKTGADTGFTAPVTAGAATSDVDVGIAFPATASLGNFVWRDENGDGLQGVGEDGRPAQVELWNENRTQMLASTTATALGAYSLQAPRGATYRLRFRDATYPAFADPGVGGDDSVDSDPSALGADAGWTDPVVVGSGTASISTIDAGVVYPTVIGNFVWDDLNANGVQDAGELGLGGVTVQLWNSAKTQLYAQTTTAANGTYTLVSRGPRSYRIRVLLPGGGDQFSPKDAAGDDQTDSDINPVGVNFGFSDSFNIAHNVISTTIWDAGIDRF